MKTRILISSITIACGFISCNKNEHAPQLVKDALAAKFLTAKAVHWEKESSKEWEAEFMMDGKEYSVIFLSDGSWNETEYVISLNEVPNHVLDVFDMEFNDYEIEEIELSETSKGIVYEFSVNKDEDYVEVVIDASGNIIKKTQDQDRDQDDSEGEEDD